MLGVLGDTSDVLLLGVDREVSHPHVIDHSLTKRCHTGLLSRENIGLGTNILLSLGALAHLDCEADLSEKGHVRQSWRRDRRDATALLAPHPGEMPSSV